MQNAESGTVEVEAATRWKMGVVAALVLHSAFIIQHSAFPALVAEATQEEVLRSIGRNVSESGDNGRVLAILAGVAGVVVLLVVVGQRRGRADAGPKTLHSHAKLLKEVLRTVPLKPAEVKQLKLLLQESRSRDADTPAPESPLTLVLCPSLLIKAAQSRSQRVNGKVVAGLAKKLGAKA